MKKFSKYCIFLLILITIVSISSISATDISDYSSNDNTHAISTDSGDSSVNDVKNEESKPELADSSVSSGRDIPVSSNNLNEENDEEHSTSVNITTGNSSHLNEETEIGAKIIANNSQPIGGGTATITISKNGTDMHTETVNLDENDTVKFKWTPTSAGVYDVLIKFNEYINNGTKWMESNATNSYEVNVGTTTQITSVNSSAVYDPFDIIGDITASDGQLLNGSALITILKGDKNILQTDVIVKDGHIVYNWIPKEIGNYSIRLVYNRWVKDDIVYASSVANQSFEVIRNNNLKLTVNNVKMYYKDGTKLILKVLTQDGHAVNNLTVHVKINGKTYNVVTDGKGIGHLAITLNPNTYNVVTSIPDTHITAKSTFTVNNWKKSLVSLEPKSLTKYYKTANKFTITLKHNNVLIPNEIITVKIGKTTYRTKTNSKGVASLAVNLAPKTYTARTSINIAGITKSKNAKIVIKKWQKRYAKLTVKKLVKEYQDANKLQAKLTYKGEAIAGERVKLLFNKKVYIAKTNNKGIAYFRLFQKVGKYRAKVSANVTGVSLSAATTVTIEPAKVTLTRSDPVSWSGSIINGTIILIPNYKKGSTIYLTFSHNKKPMVFKTVTLCVDKDKDVKQMKKSEVKVTNKKGRVYLSTKGLKIGSHKLYVTFYSGDPNFYSLKWGVDFNLI
ncbi:hypothetical protein [uncultured Methanobrevibacter sp.]|uniref:hypothetical protein n=1 Tax=uncultured Methanobrevibacter sp. TaxID=253161 RepID=UPI0025FD3210|nr:hypothetical protein [uncultured Methanobrevibacter sp.]